MPKDDYFVIAYQVLSHLYSCLKKGKSPDSAILDAPYFGIVQSYWDYIIRNLHQGGHISGVLVIELRDYPDGAVRIQPNAQITPKGIQYLEENSMLQKAKSAIKDIAA